MHFPHGAVLELVNLDVIEAILPFFPNGSIRLQEIQRKADKIREVQRANRFLALHVLLHDLLIQRRDHRPDAFVFRTANARHILHVLLRFIEIDDLQDLFKAGVIQLQLALLIDLAQDRFLLSGIDNLKRLGQEELFCILPKQPGAESVISANQ